MRKRGLLLTPEETETPPELSALEHLLASGGIMASSSGGSGGGIGKLSEQATAIRVSPTDPSVPEREPLPMEASVLKYLRPRDALTIFTAGRAARVAPPPTVH
jgi:hypothetical protein